MLDIFELSPIDEKDEEEIKKGIMEDIVRAYFIFVQYGKNTRKRSGNF